MLRSKLIIVFLFLFSFIKISSSQEQSKNRSQEFNDCQRSEFSVKQTCQCLRNYAKEYFAKGNLDSSSLFYHYLLQEPYTDTLQRFYDILDYQAIVQKKPRILKDSILYLFDLAESIAIIPEYKDEMQIKLLQAYNINYLLSQNYTQAENIGLTMESIFSQNPEKNLNDRMGNLNSLNNLYIEQGLPELALPYLDTIVEYIPLGVHPTLIAPTYYTRGRANYLLARYEESTLDFIQAKNEFEKIFGTSNHPAIVSCNSYIGLNYVGLERYDEGIVYGQQNVKEANKFYKCPSSELTAYLRELATAYYYDGQINQAKAMLDKAKNCYGIEADSLNLYLEKTDDLEETFALLELEIRLFDGSQKDWTKILEIVLKLYCADLTHLNLADKTNMFRPIIEIALAKLFEEYNQSKDKNTLVKAIALMDFIKVQKGNYFLQILEKDAEYKIIFNEYNKLELQQFEYRLEHKGIEHLTGNKLVLERLKNKMNNISNNILNPKLNNFFANYENLIDRIPKNTPTLLMFAGGEAIYQINFHGNKEISFHSKKWRSIELSKLKSFNINSNTTINDIVDWQNIISEYIQLPELNNNENLLIVSDNWLNTQPLDLLKYQSQYLIEKTPISFLSQFSDIENDWATKSKTQIDKSYALAPFIALDPALTEFDYSEIRAKQINALLPLKYSKVEVEAISKIIPDLKVLESENIDKLNIKSILSNSDLVHFATHAKANFLNPNISYLALLPSGQNGSNQLFRKEISFLDIDCKLVVLSACETGTGVVNKSKGAMALDQSLLAAGAKCVLSTLWQVDDKSTSLILTRFYEELAKGKEKHHALQIAKLKYLESNPDANPYLWSSFKITGETNSIMFNKKSTWCKWMFFLIGILIIFIISYKYFSKKKYD